MFYVSEQRSLEGEKCQNLLKSVILLRFTKYTKGKAQIFLVTVKAQEDPEGMKRRVEFTPEIVTGNVFFQL